MSEYKWIKDSGTVKADELFMELKKYKWEGKRFLAYHADSFKAGHAADAELAELNVNNLLELRIFSEEEELYYCRSCIGEDFQWRLASENGPEEASYMVQYQTLDINTAKMEQDGFLTDRHGNLILYTTVGGKYALPVHKDDNCSKLIAYLDYDQNGMAKIADYRLCGFCKRNNEGR